MAAPLIIHEIFCSLQGESTYVGRPCVFIRLTGCDLRCSWCDTTYAFEGGTEMPIRQILDAVQAYHCPLVEVTGGEPLMQESAPDLLRALCDSGYEVMLETGGHRDISVVDPRVKRVVDIKCPSSGMEKRQRFENFEFLTPHDEIKCILADRIDYDWAVRIVEHYHLDTRCTVLFAPVFGALENRTLAEWILKDSLHVRFQLQQHKYIWDPLARGV
jgi:7-carboxy-7-deazaguanine synthase